MFPLSIDNSLLLKQYYGQIYYKTSRHLRLALFFFLIVLVNYTFINVEVLYS